MTYFLPEKEPERTSSGLRGGVPTGSDRFGAMYGSTSLSEGYMWFENKSRVQNIRNSTYDDAIKRLGGVDRVTDRMMEGRDPFTPSREDLEKSVRQFVDEARESNPDDWADIDFDDEKFAARGLERLNAEMREYEDILSMSPPHLGADFAAVMAGAVANPKVFPLLFYGGVGGGFWNIVRREAAIGASVEAALLPGRFQAAEDLGLEDPNPVQAIAIGAAFGGIFGGGMYAAGQAIPVITDAAARGLYQARFRQTARVEGLPPVEAEIATQRMEEALLQNQPPSRLQEIMDEVRPPEPEPPRGLPPLLLRPEERMAPTLPLEEAQRVDRPFGAEPVSTEVLPRVPEQDSRPLDTPTLTAVVEGAVRDAERAEAAALRQLTGGRKYPLLAALKRRGVRIDPASPEAQELRALGITNRTMPGLFRGRKPGEEVPPSLDNQVASELEDSFPGILDATGTPRDQAYLDRQGLFDIIKREADGDQSWQTAFENVRIAREAREELERLGDPSDDFRMKREPITEGGLVINRDAYDMAFTQFEADRQIKVAVERYLRERDAWDNLLPEERAEIVYAAQQNGGPVDYLIERAYEREMAAIKSTPAREEMPFVRTDPPEGWNSEAPGAGQTGTTGARGEGASPEGRPVGEQEGGGAAGAAGDAGAAFPSERTAIGDQFTVPGTDVVQTGEAQRNRALAAAMQQQSTMRRGGQARVEDDAGSLFGEAPRDLFDEPTGPKARAVQDNVASDMRAAIEQDGDFDVDMGDGKGVRSASAVLDDLDMDDAVAARLELCGSAPGRG